MLIQLIDCGADGLGSDPLAIEAREVVSIACDPVRPDEPKCVVTLSNGNWYLVQGTVIEIMAEVIDAK